MGVLLPVVSGVLAAITAAAAAVAAVVVSIVSVVASAIAAIGAVVYGALAGAVAGTLQGLGIISSLTAANALSAIGALNATSVAVFSNVGIFVATLKAGISAFLEAIHFKTLIKVHEIVYLVSDSYREMINKVYSRISDYSRAIGLGANFMVLALNNARSIILDVSSMMGRSYDVAELTWLNELTGFLKKVNNVGTRYQNSPSLLLYDIDQWLVKPAINTKAKVMQGVLLQFENIVNIVDRSVNEIVTLRDDLQKFVNELPENIRKRIKPYIDDLTSKVNTFINSQYGPTIAKLNSFININNADILKSKSDIRGILDRILYPGDYVKEIDNMSPWERFRQEEKLFEVTNRPVLQSVPVMESVANEIDTKLTGIVDALKYEAGFNPWYIPELTIPNVQDISKIDKSKTWFVGDY